MYVQSKPRLYNTLDITTHFCETKFLSSKLPLVYDYDTW